MIVLFTVAILSVSAIGQNAYACSGRSLSVDCSGSVCDVSGTSDRSDLDVTIKLSEQGTKGKIHSIAQSSVSGGSYSATFNVSNLPDGAYTITATQSASGQASTKYSVPVDIDVSDGTSTSSVSINHRVSYQEGTYAHSENLPTATSFKKLTITASGMEGSNIINVRGTTDKSDVIIIKVTAPNGNLVSVDQLTPSDGSYATTIFTGGPLWSQDGTYMITAQQGPTNLGNTLVGHAANTPNIGLINYQTSAEVEIADGHVIPEFGVIAAMILAVAIVSIIVVTAKTKLSIVPRY